MKKKLIKEDLMYLEGMNSVFDAIKKNGYSPEYIRYLASKVKASSNKVMMLLEGKEEDYNLLGAILRQIVNDDSKPFSHRGSWERALSTQPKEKLAKIRDNVVLMGKLIALASEGNNQPGFDMVNAIDLYNMMDRYIKQQVFDNGVSWNSRLNNQHSLL